MIFSWHYLATLFVPYTKSRNNMISVIIPTLWKAKELHQMIPQLIENKKVGEIIIIDNAATEERLPDIFFSEKVKIFSKGYNIYVNPSWNFGVEKASYDKICLMSDDVLFDPDVFDLVCPKITEKVGTIGPHGKGIKDFFVKSPLMRVEPSDKFWHGYGTLIFLHKKNFLPIPEELLIYYGDLWLYDYNALRGKQNYFINKFCVQTKMGTTSQLFKPQLEKEKEIHLPYFKKLYSEYKKGKLLSIPTVKV